jgi:hypothetical protein
MSHWGGPFPVEGARPIRHPIERVCAAVESGCLRVQPKVGGKSHRRLNISAIPIANKYREGKLQRTLKREFNRT